MKVENIHIQHSYNNNIAVTEKLTDFEQNEEQMFTFLND